MSCRGHLANPGIQRPPKNVCWVDTFLMTLPVNIALMEPGTCMISRVYELALLRDRVRFELTKLNEGNIKVSCVRYPSRITPPDKGYVLRFHFTVISVDEATKTVNMTYNENIASVFYSNNSFKRKYESGYRSYVWQLKIVIRLIEYDNLENEWRERHEVMFEEVMSKACETEEKREELAFLLKRPELCDVYTGRNNALFVLIKTAYISRTEKYSKELVEYLKARMRNDDEPLPNLNFSKILNWIHCGENGPIESHEIIRTFLKAYRLGLNFLKTVTTTYMIDLLEGNPDLDFVVDVIQAADLVDDRVLFDHALCKFIPNIQAVWQSDLWKEEENKSNGLARSIIHGLESRVKSPGFYVPMI